jgi:hypothetical protein
MTLVSDIKFQKALALATSANPHEAQAAERAARRLMAAHNIDPVTVPNSSLYSRTNFADNPLLQKLRDEWRAAHPDFYYGKPDRFGNVRRLKRKPRPMQSKPVDIHEFDGLFR